MTLLVKVGTFTKIGTTGTQSITGVGFTPKILILTNTAATTVNTFQSDSALYFGAATSSTASTQRAFFYRSFDAQAASNADTGWHTTSAFIDGPAGSITVRATLLSFNVDGFTLNWVLNTAASSYIISYIAIGGDLTHDSVGHFSAPATTGNNAVTGVGFMPDMVLLLGTNHRTDDSVNSFATYSLGAFNAAGEQGVIAGCIENNQATMDTSRYQRTNKCLAMFSTTDTTALTHEASFVSMNADGFTLNYTTANITAKRVMYIALKGLETKISSFTAPTTNPAPISQSTTGIGFQPSGVIFLTVGNTASSSITTHCRQSLGAATASDTEFCDWSGDKDAVADSITAVMKDNDACIRVSDEVASAGSSTTEALADYTSNDEDGFTLNWSVRGTSNAYEIIYIALGPGNVVATDEPVKHSSSMSAPTGLEVTTKKRYTTSSMI